jgi:Carbon-nitrogen hydrolase
VKGYPLWIWDYPIHPTLLLQYIRNCLAVDSPEMARITLAAKENAIYVALGFSEVDNGSLYMAQALISPNGQIVITDER